MRTHKEINFSPFATNVLDHVYDENLTTPNGDKVLIGQETNGDFYIRINGELIGHHLSNLEASYILNTNCVGVPSC